MRLLHRSPLSLVLSGSAWLALMGNLPLWQALWRLPDLPGWRGVVMGLVMAGMVFCLCVSILSIVSWRGLLRPSLVTNHPQLSGSAPHLMQQLHQVQRILILTCSNIQ